MEDNLLEYQKLKDELEQVLGTKHAVAQRTTSCAVHAPSARVHTRTYARTRALPRMARTHLRANTRCALHVASRASHVFVLRACRSSWTWSG